MLLEAETNKYCPSGYDIGAISNLITWVLNFFLSVGQIDTFLTPLLSGCRLPLKVFFINDKRGGVESGTI